MKSTVAIFAAALATLAIACSHAAPLPPKAIELNRAGAEALAAGDLPTAEARLAVAIEYNPRFVEAWVNLGFVELARHHYREARHHFDKALDLNPDLPTPHHGLGYLEDVLGHGEAAEKHYRAALKVDPGFAPARANLARRLFKRRAYEEAREQFHRLTEVAPGDVDGWAGLCDALLALDRELEADEVLEQAVRRFIVETPAIALHIARQMLRRERYSEAEARLALLTATEEPSRRAAAWAWLAVARLAQGSADTAIAAATESLKLDAEQPVAVYAMAVALRARGDAEADVWSVKAKRLGALKAGG